MNILDLDRLNIKLILEIKTRMIHMIQGFGLLILDFGQMLTTLFGSGMKIIHSKMNIEPKVA